MKKICVFCNINRLNSSYIQKEEKIVQDIEQMYKEYFETVYKYILCLTRNKDIAYLNLVSTIKSYSVK